MLAECFNPPPSAQPGGTDVLGLELEVRGFQSTAQRTAGRNGAGGFGLRLELPVSIHRPAHSRAEQQSIFSTQSNGGFNPPLSAQPGGTPSGQTMRLVNYVSIHRPAHSRAERKRKGSFSGVPGVSIHRPAHSRAERREGARR